MTLYGMESSYHSFEDLRIWQEGLKLCDGIYSTLKSCRDYGLRDQMQRSSVSIPSNIAEGFELHTNKAFIRYLYIAKASGGELRTQLYIAIKQGYVDKKKGQELIGFAKRLNKMIANFITTRKGKIRKQ